MPAAPGELEMGPPPAAAAAVDVPEYRQVERGRFDAAVGKTPVEGIAAAAHGERLHWPCFPPPELPLPPPRHSSIYPWIENSWSGSYRTSF